MHCDAQSLQVTDDVESFETTEKNEIPVSLHPISTACLVAGPFLVEVSSKDDIKKNCQENSSPPHTHSSPTPVGVTLFRVLILHIKLTYLYLYIVHISAS